MPFSSSVRFGIHVGTIKIWTHWLVVAFLGICITVLPSKALIQGSRDGKWPGHLPIFQMTSNDLKMTAHLRSFKFWVIWKWLVTKWLWSFPNDRGHLVIRSFCIELTSYRSRKTCIMHVLNNTYVRIIYQIHVDYAICTKWFISFYNR